jgi:uncharacterized protein (TIRG00374 family)
MHPGRRPGSPGPPVHPESGRRQGVPSAAMRLARWLRRPIVWLPVSIGLLVLLGWRSQVWETTALRGFDPGTLGIAALLSSIVPVLWALRSGSLLAAADRPVGVRPLVPMTAFANTINNLTPGSTGEVFRLYLLRVRHGVDYASGGAVIVVERLGAVGYLASSSLLSWLAWSGSLPGVLAAGLMALIVAAPGIVYGLGLRPLGVVRVLPIGGLVGRQRWASLSDWLGRMDGTIARLVGQPRGLIAFATACGAIFAITTCQLVLVGRAVGVTVDPLAAWGALGLATMAGVLSLLPFGLGATDLTLAALLGVAGVPLPQAAAMAFGYRIVSTLPLGLAGVASYAYLSASLPEAGLGGVAREVQAGGGAPESGSSEA